MKNLRLLLCLCLILALAICSISCKFQKKSGSTVIEPEITVEYLEGDYAKQLLKDGAEYLFGNISLSTNEDGEHEVVIDAKELVEDYEGKKLIENRNYEISYVLTPDARCTFRKGLDSKLEPDIVTGDKFVKAYEKETKGMTMEQKKNYNASHYYKIYIMNDQIELMLDERVEI